MMTLADRILEPDADIGAISAWLDGLDPARRLEEVRALGPKPQRALWRLCRGRVATLEDFVPKDRPALQPVRHFGRNTLPAFTHFEKRFCRPPEGEDRSMLWGYNEGSTRAVVGPGYFIVRRTEGDSRGDTVIDYTRVPPNKPTEWPAIKQNERGISRFVYAGMQDFMRKVSGHVTIGRAYRGGRETANCFMLCREP